MTYWEQAHEFQRVAQGLPLQSAPLLLYYAYMNAAKALLSVKAIPFDPRHGVRAHNMRRPSSKISITNEGVKIEAKGVLPALSGYFQEPETSRTHSLQEIFFNLPCIHRSYCLTYQRQRDMFLPIKDCFYSWDKVTKSVHLTAELSGDFVPGPTLKRLPSEFGRSVVDGPRFIRSIQGVAVKRPSKPSKSELAGIADLNRQLRNNLTYIHGAQTLWYIKARTRGPRRIARQPLTLMLAGMHRLSEICRYRPIELISYMSGQKNWLLTEFIQMTPVQFFDEIASEITGYRFQVPNVRPAT